MEPENIDWSTIESTFEEDYTYENINAPKWVDLSAPTESVDDDEAWFCNPNCKHHMNVEDSLKPTRNLKMKLLRSMSISEILPFRRDVKQKENKSSEDNDNENQNPNHYIKQDKEKKKKQRDDSDANARSRRDRKPGLRRTFSARNLVGGGEVVNQITGFCGELKRLARNGLKKGSSDKVEDRVSCDNPERVGQENAQNTGK